MTPEAPPDPPSPNTLGLRPLFPLALGELQLTPDPLDTAIALQDILRLRGKATGNPEMGCAWTGDLHGADQLHHHPSFAALFRRLGAAASDYVTALGFDRSRVALHLQRAWPVVSEAGQGIGRHHHPNAHISGVYYLTGDGGSASGCLRLWPPRQANELIAGLAVGYGGPIMEGSPDAMTWNAPCWDVAPRAGLLVLFPAGVDHAVLENSCAEERRVSIAMDFYLTAPATQSRMTKAEYLAPHPSSWLEMSP